MASVRSATPALASMTARALAPIALAISGCTSRRSHSARSSCASCTSVAAPFSKRASAAAATLAMCGPKATGLPDNPGSKMLCPPTGCDGAAHEDRSSDRQKIRQLAERVEQENAGCTRHRPAQLAATFPCHSRHEPASERPRRSALAAAARSTAASPGTAPTRAPHASSAMSSSPGCVLAAINTTRPSHQRPGRGGRAVRPCGARRWLRGQFQAANHLHARRPARRGPQCAPRRLRVCIANRFTWASIGARQPPYPRVAPRGALRDAPAHQHRRNLGSAAADRSSAGHSSVSTRIKQRGWMRRITRSVIHRDIDRQQYHRIGTEPCPGGVTASD